MSNSVLEVRFRYADDRWYFRLCPGGDEQEGLSWTAWNRPEADWLKLELMESLFTEERGSALLDRAWDLRLRPESLNGLGEGIPEAPWDELLHPTSKLHVFEMGWTVTQVLRVPRDGSTNGLISVIGSDSLARELAGSIGPVVLETTLDTLREGSLVVVAGRVTDKEAAAIEAGMAAKNCPFVIWCEHEPQLPRVPCAFKRGELAPKKLTDWVRRLLVAIRKGIDPVRAFAETRSPVQERGLFSMRGAYKSWNVKDAGIAGFALPPHWYILLDRVKQEGHLNNLVEGLLRNDSPRRIHVAVTPGPVGSGLDLFRQRPLRSVHKYHLVEWEAGWAEAPGSTIQWLMTQVRAQDQLSIPHRLQERAAPFDNGRALFLIRHSTTSLLATDSTTQVTVPELKEYLHTLSELAAALATSSLRMLFQISVLGAETAMLQSLKSKTTHFACDVLVTLDPGVPVDELSQWLDAHDVPYKQEDLEAWSQFTYDQLVKAIVNRNPRLVHE